ncbi:MAG: hypothetical protein R2856_08995 [Caldilineaceae bacterium]
MAAAAYFVGLGRQSHYINPLLLVIVSLALGVYTFSMAASLTTNGSWIASTTAQGADVAFEPSQRCRR